MKMHLHVLVRRHRCLMVMYGYMRQQVGRCGGTMENLASGPDTDPPFRGEKSGYLLRPEEPLYN